MLACPVDSLSPRFRVRVFRTLGSMGLRDRNTNVGPDLGEFWDQGGFVPLVPSTSLGSQFPCPVSVIGAMRRWG